MTPEAGAGGEPVRSLGAVPCREHGPDLWFAESPGRLELAKTLCRGCVLRASCLDEAIRRREPWGVWGGEIFSEGVVVPRKRGRGRPRSRAG